MASDLLGIGRSGALAARAALDLTAQNIANAATDGYVRRSLRLQEVAATGDTRQVGDTSLSGVRVDRVVRNADPFRQTDFRRTTSDTARADAELAGLETVQSAIEQTGVYPALVQFEGGLRQLASDPVNPSLRAALLETSRTLAGTFNGAATALDAAGETLRFQASDGVFQVNRLAQELGRLNLRLARAANASNDQTTLLDQRDLLLQQISQQSDLTAVISPTDQTVEVRLGGAAGPVLVTGSTAATLAMATAPDGIVSFTLDNTTLAPVGGALAGEALALGKLADVHARLDQIAASVIDTANAAQAGGVALDGSTGQPLFAGNSGATMALALASGAGIATAPAGSGANSRNPGNLDALRIALAAADPAGQSDALIFDISSTVSGRTITRDALQTIAESSKLALAAQAGVSLDDEAVNLVRFQQAFQASGRVMAVASSLFDTLLQIR